MEQPQTCFQLLLIRSLQELGLLFRLAANEKERQKNRVFCKLLQPLSCPWSEWVGWVCRVAWKIVEGHYCIGPSWVCRAGFCFHGRKAGGVARRGHTDFQLFCFQQGEKHLTRLPAALNRVVRNAVSADGRKSRCGRRLKRFTPQWRFRPLDSRPGTGDQAGGMSDISPSSAWRSARGPG